MSGANDINPMLPGKKIISIFGFCDIRNFTDATEVLQEGVMVFVNEIGEIVHGIVDKFSGAANKNIEIHFYSSGSFKNTVLFTMKKKMILNLTTHTKFNSCAI